MQSKAATIEAYLAELPEDRREAIEAIRKVILKDLSNIVGWANRSLGLLKSLNYHFKIVLPDPCSDNPVNLFDMSNSILWGLKAWVLRRNLPATQSHNPFHDRGSICGNRDPMAVSGPIGISWRVVF